MYEPQCKRRSDVWTCFPAVWSGDLNRIVSAVKLQKDGFSQRCIQRLLSEDSLVVMFYRTTGHFSPKQFFHIPSVCLIWAAPSIFLAHGLPHGSGQLFLVSLAVVASQKCFYSCDGKHTLISFPTESRKRQKGIHFLLSQQKENVYKVYSIKSIKLRLWVPGD